MREKKQSLGKYLMIAVMVALLQPGLVKAEGIMLAKASDTQWLSFDMATRDELNFTQGAASDGGWSQKIGVDSVRAMFSGQLEQDVKFTLNSEYSSTTQSMQIMDAIAQFEFSDDFNIWIGRFLPPSDRSNLSGPYYLNSWNFKGVLDPYYSVVAGRDDGIALWGQVGGGAFKWQVGAFDANTVYNPSSSLLYAARLTFNFLDPDPGYYNSSTYLGKDILALGIVGQYQPYGASTSSTNIGDFAGGNIDLLFEKKTDDGAFDLEAAYYALNTGGATGVYTAGDGYFVLASYLFDKIQPNVRWMSSLPTVGAETDYLDIGLAYYLEGYSKLVANYELTSVSGSGTSTSQFLLATQLIY